MKKPGILGTVVANPGVCDIVDQRIIAVIEQTVSDGRGQNYRHLVGLRLANGTTVSFDVIETEIGEYLVIGTVR